MRIVRITEKNKVMKANEAPEKIYVSNYSSGLTYNWHNERLAVNDIEYTRTDAFIEKACEWLYLQLNEINMEGEDMKNFLKDFRKYMKGE